MHLPARLALHGAMALCAGSGCGNYTYIRDSSPVVAWPSPSRAREERAVRENAACEGCHPTQADEWRASRHRSAATNAAFTGAYVNESTAFCMSCHAPESAPGRPPSTAVRELGVGCVTCHLQPDGSMLAAPARDDARSHVHVLIRTPAFTMTSACASCHEFRFPQAFGEDDGAFMQSTVREHRDSRASGTGCSSCHMPRGLRGASHRFDEVRDATWLRRALRAEAQWVAPDTLRIRLEQVQGAHGFPTGDLFRRLEVGVGRTTAAGATVQRDVQYLSRRFALTADRPGRTLLDDTRLFDEPVEVLLALPGGRDFVPGTRLRWWVSLQRVATVAEGKNPTDATLESETLIYDEWLP